MIGGIGRCYVRRNKNEIFGEKNSMSGVFFRVFLKSVIACRF